MSRADDDHELLRELSEKEAMVADAATRLAYERAADWLTSKQSKAEQFPGGDLVHAKGRAAAYQNAAQELYGWAMAMAGEPLPMTYEESSCDDTGRCVPPQWGSGITNCVHCGAELRQDCYGTWHRWDAQRGRPVGAGELTKGGKE